MSRRRKSTEHLALSTESLRVIVLLVSLLGARYSVLTSSAQAATYYVSPTGSDSNPGTAVSPFRTIQHAADVVNPGDTVAVNDGVYSAASGASSIVTMSRGGTSGALVTFVSSNPWGAKLDGQNNPSLGSAINFSGGAAYIRIKNFELYGLATGLPGGTVAIDVENSAGFINIVGNNIHDIGKICTDTAYGQDAVFGSGVPNVTIEQNLIHDIGRFAPGENGCNPSAPYYQNHDHGIYLHDGASWTILNNIFYNITRGWSIQLYPNPVDNVLIINNTLAFPNPYRDGQIIVGAQATNSTIANNIFYQPTTAGILFDIVAAADTLTLANNLSTDGINSNATTPAGVTYANNLANQTTSGLMVNPTTYDFHLATGSPAIGAGTAVNAPVTDFAGVARPNPPSIGAYEYNGSTAPPPPANACDINGDGVVNVVDVQLEVNMALGINSCTNPSGTCTVTSVQRVVNSVLGGTCVAP